jgi:hypothetical protein
MKPWTSREQKALLRFVDLGCSDPEIANKLDRTVISIADRRRALRYLRRPSRLPIRLVNPLEQWIALPWLEARMR